MKLKHFRVLSAILFGIVLSSLFIDIQNSLPTSFSNNMASTQFTPALMATFSGIRLSSLVLGTILLVSLLFGRVYCSSICPLGILQDLIRRISKPFLKKKNFRYKKGLIFLPFGILAFVAVSYIAGTSMLVTQLDPYSLFGRIVSYLLRPIVAFVNNIGADILVHFENYSLLYRYDPVAIPLAVLGITMIFLAALIVLSSKFGRLYCNTICPVGSLLRILAKGSLFKIEFDAESCSKCGRCVKTCKSQCIDLRKQKVDFERCVTCYNCLDVCPSNAIGYRKKSKNTENNTHSTNSSKRDFIRNSGMLALVASGVWSSSKASTISQYKNRKHGGKRRHHEKGSHEKGIIPENRTSPVAPPGAVSTERFNDLCTGCSLCVSACPTKTLQPALFEYGLSGMMQPHMDYSSGLCNFDCTICSEVCPNDALIKVTQEEKHTLQLGRAKFIKGNCVVHTDGTDCGACSEHCPSKAVAMVPFINGLVIPKVNEDICVGCGACEFACPVRPNRAIFVDGNPEHKVADKPVTKKATIELEDDFPF